MTSAHAVHPTASLPTHVEVAGRRYQLAYIALAGPTCMILGDIVGVDSSLVPEEKALEFARHCLASAEWHRLRRPVGPCR